MRGLRTTRFLRDYEGNQFYLEDSKDKKERIVLINPRGEEDKHDGAEDSRRVPLGLLAIASFMQSCGYQIDLLDCRVYPENLVWERLEKLLDNSNLNNVGLSVMTGQIANALKCCQFIRNRRPEISIVWGGVHGSLFPEQTSAHPLVDYVVTNMGERPYLELTQRLSKGLPLEGIDGVAVNGKLTPRQTSSDYRAEELPALDYDLLDLPCYLGPFPHFLLSPKKPIRLLQAVTSRGCPWRCTFCINVVTGQRRWQGLPAERVLDELEELIQKYNLEMVRFLDEEMFVNRRRLHSIVDGILERGIKIIWAANAHASYFNGRYINVDFARKLYTSGMRIISIGAESGSSRVLDALIKKDITTKDLLRSAEVCQVSGLIPRYSWMLGLPSETKNEMRETIALMGEMLKACPAAQHSALWIFRPYPGGELYKRCLSYGLHEPQSLDEWVQESGVSDERIGYFGMEKLAWIEDSDFVQFLTDKFILLATPLGVAARQGIPSLVCGLFAKTAYIVDHRLWRQAIMKGLEWTKGLYSLFGHLDSPKNLIRRV